MYADNAQWFSRISDSRKCLRYYQEKHLLKTPVEPEKSSDLEFGSAMHLALENMLRGEGAQEIFTMYWDSVKDAGLDYGRFNWLELQGMAEVLLARFERLHSKHFEPFKLEERIYSELGGHPFEGTPDFVGKYKGIPSVVDFKTAGYRYAKEKIIVDEQMAGYAALSAKAWNYPVEQAVYVVLIKDRKSPSIQVLTTQLTSDILNSTITNITDTCEDLKTRMVFPKNPLNCVQGERVCKFFSRCYGSKGSE